jgi:hypothetical protein
MLVEADFHLASDDEDCRVTPQGIGSFIVGGVNIYT